MEGNEPRAGIENKGVKPLGGYLACIRVLNVTASPWGQVTPYPTPDELSFEGRPACTVLSGLAVCLWQVLSPLSPQPRSRLLERVGEGVCTLNGGCGQEDGKMC